MENAQLKLHCKYYIWMTSFLHALWLFKSYICVTYFFHELQFWALSKFRLENTPLNWQCIWMFSFLHALGLHKRNICVAHFFHELQFWNLKKILNGKYRIKLVHKYYIQMAFITSCSWTSQEKHLCCLFLSWIAILES